MLQGILWTKRKPAYKSRSCRKGTRRFSNRSPIGLDEHRICKDSNENRLLEPKLIKEVKITLSEVDVIRQDEPTVMS